MSFISTLCFFIKILQKIFKNNKSHNFNIKISSTLKLQKKLIINVNEIR